jgi:hypothetical protein
MGIDWWRNEPFLSSQAVKNRDKDLEEENRALKERLKWLESRC